MDSKKFLYDRKGPWPQPNPQRPMGEAPIVLNIPLRERLDWTLHVGLRIVVKFLVNIPVGVWMR